MAATTDMHGYVNATDVSDVQYSQSAASNNFVVFTVSWSLMILITTAGIVGNSLVIYVIMTRQGMRTVSNLLLVNLAVADLIVLITWLNYTIFSILFAYSILHYEIFLSEYLIRSYIFRLSVYVSVYTLTLIVL